MSHATGPQRPPQSPFPQGQQPGYPPQGYPQQPYPGHQQQPPKKSHTLRNVMLILGAVFVLAVGGCMAFVGLAANSVNNAIVEGQTETGGTENPVAIQPGKAFEVRGFAYAAGWKLGEDEFDALAVTKLKVTNNREKQDGAIVQIKLWQGTEVVATTDCTTEPIAVGTTTSLTCISADQLPAAYDRVTINDSF